MQTTVAEFQRETEKKKQIDGHIHRDKGIKNKDKQAQAEEYSALKTDLETKRTKETHDTKTQIDRHMMQTTVN